MDSYSRVSTRYKKPVDLQTLLSINDYSVLVNFEEGGNLEGSSGKKNVVGIFFAEVRMLMLSKHPV